MPTYRIDLAYDGAGFHGYASQPGLRTVQGELEYALGRLVGPVMTSVAGRTDAGVHATGQVVTFKTTQPLDAARVGRSLLRMLGPEIAVRAVREVAPGFDARFSAVSRSYRYHVLAAPQPDPLLRHRCWHVPHRLDLDAMNAAAAALVGTHDFASLCRTAPGRSTERTVLSAAWQAAGGVLRFEVTATAFCHQMVRSMVALTVAVGRGLVDAGAVPAILAARDRNAARGAAPPHGLVLVGVAYPEDAR